MSSVEPEQKKRASKAGIWIISAIVALVFMGMGVSVLKMLLSEDSRRRTRAIKMVQLVQPPPPPKIKEQPPEPEIKKEEIMEPEPVETPPEDMNDAAEDDSPPIDDLLGLDADGSGGSDGFGLKAKKGGRSLIGGEQSQRFAWYTAMVQKEINQKVQDYFDENGGIPEGNRNTYVKIVVDDEGRIIQYDILRSSGNKRMDDAVIGALASVDIREMPPMDMPRVLKFKISSQG
ncbi:MAG: TonB C-terminal domain-containing protein [Desulfobacteraceae bacterium]|nr:MAG: TonB C-terminal domain-containing protein [Desulfobacteraceae bacterium]